MDQEVQEARAKLAAKYGKGTQLGGKGKLSISISLFLLNHHSLAHAKLFVCYCRNHEKSQEDNPRSSPGNRWRGQKG